MLSVSTSISKVCLEKYVFSSCESVANNRTTFTDSYETLNTGIYIMKGF